MGVDVGGWMWAGGRTWADVGRCTQARTCHWWQAVQAVLSVLECEVVTSGRVVRLDRRPRAGPATGCLSWQMDPECCRAIPRFKRRCRPGPGGHPYPRSGPPDSPENT